MGDHHVALGLIGNEVSGIGNAEPPPRSIQRILVQALIDVRQELWVDFCLHMGRTDIDPAPFNARPHIRIIDAALAAAKGTS